MFEKRFSQKNVQPLKTLSFFINSPYTIQGKSVHIAPVAQAADKMKNLTLLSVSHLRFDKAVCSI